MTVGGFVLAYLKPYYHIEEVCKILQKHDSLVTVDDVIQLGIINKLKIGLYLEGTENCQFLVPSMTPTPYKLVKFTVSGKKDIKTLARQLYNTEKKRLQGAELDWQRQVVFDDVEDFLRSYRENMKEGRRVPFIGFDVPFIINNEENYIPVEDFNFINDTEVHPIQLGITINRPMLIYPVWDKTSHSAHWLTTPHSVQVGIKDLCRFYTDSSHEMIHFMGNEEMCWSLFSYISDGSLIRELLEKNALYITREELMRYEQAELGIDHGLELNKTTDSEIIVLSGDADKPNNTALKVVGLFMQYLAENDKYQNQQGAPNKSKIKDFLLDLAEDQNISKHGLNKADESILTNALNYLAEQKEK